MKKRLDFIAFIFLFYKWVFEYKHSSLQSIPAPDPPEKLSYLSVIVSKDEGISSLKIPPGILSIICIWYESRQSHLSRLRKRRKCISDYLSKYVFCFTPLLLLHHIYFQSFCQCPSSSCHRHVFGV